MKLPQKIIFCLLLGCQLFCGQLAAAAPRVENVEAEVTAAGTLPAAVQQRMQTSVRTIAEQLMLGRDLTAASAARAENEQIIHEVFDKVLVGYTVRDVQLLPGETTKVKVSLMPWSAVISETEISLQVEGMNPAIEKLVRQDMQGVEQVFADTLQGLPEAAADWTNGVLKHSLNDFMAQNLPEFRADFDVVPEQKAKVKLTVYPRTPVVRTVDLNMRSDTVPNFTLLNHRSLMEENVNMVIGVPVGFVKRHREELQQLMADRLDETADFRAMEMKTKVTFSGEENMSVMSRSDTARYLIRLTGWYDVGRRNRDNDKTVFKLHTGVNLTPYDEFFLQTAFLPEKPDWGWEAGYRHRIFPWTALETRYNLREKGFIAGIEQQLSPKWLLRYEYRWIDETGEAAVRYKLHDFLSIELVNDKKDDWLRLIGNF